MRSRTNQLAESPGVVSHLASFHSREFRSAGILPVARPRRPRYVGVVALLFASSFLLLPGASKGGLHPARVRIPGVIQVEGETVRLSDLLPPGSPAELGEMGARIVLGNSPLPASQRVISREQIELHLREFPSILGQLELPERLIITCKQRRLSSEEIGTAIETFLGAEGLRSPRTANLNALSLQAPVFVTKHDPGLKVRRMEPDRVRRQIRFLLWASNEPQVLPFYVTVGELSRRVDWASLNYVETDSGPIRPDNQGGPWKREGEDSPELVSGTRAGASVRQVGSDSKTTSPPVILVAKGKPAKLVVETETLRMTALVTPLESGVKGQLIHVRNSDTQRVFEAQVVGVGLLQAELAGE